MKISLVVFIIALLGMSSAYATTTAVIHLDHIISVAHENDMITFSGQMTT